MGKSRSQKRRATKSRHEETSAGGTNVGNTCLICNNEYMSVSVKKDIQGLTDKTQVLCRLFDIDSTTFLSSNNQDLFSSYNPFCSNCAQKIENLGQLMKQLEAIEKQVQAYHKEIGNIIIETFASSPALGPQYALKLQIFEKCVFDRQFRQGQQSSNPPKANGSILKQSEQNPPPLLHCAKRFNETQDLNDKLNIGVGETFPELNVASSSIIDADYLDDFFDTGADINISPNEEIISPNDVHEARATDSAQVKVKAGSKGIVKQRNFTTRNKLQERIVRNQETTCEFCSKTFSAPFRLAKHITLHTGEKPYPCSYCGRTFRDSSNRKRHEICTHSGANERSKKCDICGIVYKNSHTYNDHRRRVHLGYVRPFIKKMASECDICGKVLSSRKTLASHVRVYHMLQFKEQYCRICGKPAKTAQEIKRHEQTHKSVWELEQEGVTFFYKCNICERSFPSKEKLRFHHSFLHTNAEPIKVRKIKGKPLQRPLKYKCKDCPDHPGFAKSWSLKVHSENGHTFRKRYSEGEVKKKPTQCPCKICSKPCKDSTAAREHELTHDPSRNPSFPHVCSKCPPIYGLFSKKEDLVKHFNAIHPDSPLPEVICKTTRKHPQNYMCNECPDHPGFTSRKGLNNHIKCGHGKRTRGRKCIGDKPKRIRRAKPKTDPSSQMKTEQRIRRRPKSLQNPDFVYESTSAGRDSSYEDDIKLDPRYPIVKIERLDYYEENSEAGDSWIQSDGDDS